MDFIHVCSRTEPLNILFYAWWVNVIGIHSFQVIYGDIFLGLWTMVHFNGFALSCIITRSVCCLFLKLLRVVFLSNNMLLASSSKRKPADPAISTGFQVVPSDMPLASFTWRRHLAQSRRALNSPTPEHLRRQASVQVLPVPACRIVFVLSLHTLCQL